MDWTEDTKVTCSCCGGIALAFVLGFAGIGAIDAYNPSGALRYFVAGGLALVCGVGYFVVVTIRRVRAGHKETERALRDLRMRAAHLRMEREKARREAAQEDATALQDGRAVAAPAASEPTPAPLPAGVAALVADADQSICPLCQTGILAGETYVSCPECSASYHDDCWEYNGGCAVFGCSAKA